MLDEEFYDEVARTLFYGSLPEFQRAPLTYMAEEFHRRGMTNVDQLAYIMATAYHETDRFKALGEYGEGKGRDYGVPLLSIRGKTIGYYGRGWVMLTWLQNYAKVSVAATLAFGKPIDLVNNPDMIIDNLEVNAFATFEGMITGMFTGRKIGTYINGNGTDFLKARKVINGMDKASLIAGYAEAFKEAFGDIEFGGQDGRTTTGPFRFTD
tara:strand:- start:1822 stop:2451 length:630 start_codon:yes stop_codon:yes gene_type:complete